MAEQVQRMTEWTAYEGLSEFHPDESHWIDPKNDSKEGFNEIR